MLFAGLVLDGYRLSRPIGKGGFGEVWLCVLETTGEFKALKFLAESNSRQLERELKAVIRYRSVAGRLHCPNLVPIEHVNRSQHGLYYTMLQPGGVITGSPRLSSGLSP